MRISIVTPSYNSRRYIEATLQSILEQDYPRLELWVIDGGSTDGTLEILQAFQQKYPQRLYYISEPDLNNCDAMNKGWLRASGDIIGCFGSDDIMPPGVAQYVAEYFNMHPEHAVIYGECEIIDSKSSDC